MQYYGFQLKKFHFVVPEADNIPHKNARVHVVKRLIDYLREGREMISIDEVQINRGQSSSYGWMLQGIRQ